MAGRPRLAKKAGNVVCGPGRPSPWVLGLRSAWEYCRSRGDGRPRRAVGLKAQYMRRIPLIAIGSDLSDMRQQLHNQVTVCPFTEHTLWCQRVASWLLSGCMLVHIRRHWDWSVLEGGGNSMLRWTGGCGSLEPGRRLEVAVDLAVGGRLEPVRVCSLRASLEKQHMRLQRRSYLLSSSFQNLAQAEQQQLEAVLAVLRCRALSFGSRRADRAVGLVLGLVLGLVDGFVC